MLCLVSFFLFPALFLTLVSVNFFTGSSFRFGTVWGSALLRGCIGGALTLCFGMVGKEKCEPNGSGKSGRRTRSSDAIFRISEMQKSIGPMSKQFVH